VFRELERPSGMHLQVSQDISCRCLGKVIASLSSTCLHSYWCYRCSILPLVFFLPF